MLTKIATILFLLPLAVSAAEKDYENFDLPNKPATPAVPESKYSYQSSRVNLRGKKLRIKEPSLNHQTFVFAKEAFISEKRDEAIKLLRQEMDAGLKANRDNMLLRLGQLYAEKYMEMSYRENEYFGKQLQEYEKNKALNPKLTAPRLDNSRSQKYLKDALSVFYGLEKEFPRHSKMDEVSFFIGFVELESGNNQKGISYLERVIKNFPNSRKWPEAVLYVGDYYFDSHKFKDAAGRYQMLFNKSSNLRDYAEYKLAWCDLNTGDPKKALRNMKRLIERLDKNTEEGKFNLRDQALKDLVSFYAEAEMVDDAMSFFTEMQSKDKALSNLRLLADIFRTKAKDEAAIRAYSKLIEEFPSGLDTPNLYLGLYDSQARLGKSAAATKTLMTALERFGEDSDWAKSIPEEKAAEKKSALESLAGEAAKAAFFHHNAAQKSANRGHYDYALKIYSSLLKNFPNYPDRKKVAFFQGEALFNLEKWSEASNSYMIAAQIPPKDKVSSESVYNALLALDKLTAASAKLNRYDKNEQKSVSLTPEEIPDAEQKFIEVGRYYIKEYPQGDRVVDVKFRIASIYYRRHHFNEAQDEFRNLAISHPEHRSATTAAHIVLDIDNIKKDYSALTAHAQDFAGIKKLGDSQFRKELAEIVGEIDFKGIESFEKEQQWDKAAANYLKFYEANPNSPLAEKALYNAYISYQKKGDIQKTDEMAKLFVVKFPKSGYAGKIMLGLAQESEKKNDLETAQKQYQDFYKKFPEDKEARKALYNAAVYAEVLEYNKLSLQLYDTYLKEAKPTAQETRAIEISKAKLYRKEKDLEKSAAIYFKLAKESKSTTEKLDILGELARNYEKAGMLNKKDSVVGEIKKAVGADRRAKLTGNAAYFVAESFFKELEKERKKYDAIKLRFPENDLIYLMKRKQKALIKLAKSYDDEVDRGVPEWGVAALYEKSTAYDAYVAQFRKLKIPGRYTPEERKEAEAALKQIDEKQIVPLEQKAQEIINFCAERAIQFHVVNDFAKKCRERAKKVEGTFEPEGLKPQPAYWSTRAAKEERN
ncbi:MAG: tetratricopeptide repeat protein [Deltaproteobacteria bacterium]